MDRESLPARLYDVHSIRRWSHRPESIEPSSSLRLRGLELEAEGAHLHAERARDPEAAAGVADVRRRVAGETRDLADAGGAQLGLCNIFSHFTFSLFFGIMFPVP